MQEDKKVIKGNFVWADKDKTKVDFVPDENGKFTINPNSNINIIEYCG
jgi:peroxiredoxin